MVREKNNQEVTPDADISPIELLATKRINFDSDGDGIKDDFAELKMLGASGGYGSFELEVFVSNENAYIKIFDDNGAINDGEALEFLSSVLDCKVQVDSVYSVEAVDTDNDGCDELVCRQYVWAKTHSNHIGDLVTIMRITGQTLELVDRIFEKEYNLREIINQVNYGQSVISQRET